MNKEEIKKILPHREPMLLVDEIEIDDQKVAHAKYKVKGDEFFLQGHFPDYPVVPGVILCEIMAQSSCIIIQEALIGRTPFYAGIDKVKFKKQVRPHDVVEVKARIINQKGLVFFVEGVATVDNEICAKAEMIFALVDNDKIEK
ncbi:MAG TPA: 3-hydroxyacyl-ACP dehydratase FabZ [Bacteroidales bacterium]|jgi:3-hydroxyacyl-[acyl-carrier-protein] dehydratase|nr:3-hydroxyacyl-ACP dehydratase FabZ [Bacteroidales bacterium]HOS57124.1 3-hydroxyacyl-ACP dehydratase FabZ [Bacteroidales bacterium]HRR04785.1 3-hydroxyacyl-ACP dehydratase FabZ [Bacteroidales bacterium]HRT13563.1 3-hydroxyacyl-ACP dehydratase FabZ [Bacteroidales bacterium]HXK74283.1 3-hydroxyacyl-ACP dehydratase FabZ [Bacteroidales bacterium]